VLRGGSNQIGVDVLVGNVWRCMTGIGIMRICWNGLMR